MKTKTILTLLTIALTSVGNAQTNTFPSSGNVGIGASTPLEMLHVRGPSSSSTSFPTTNSTGDAVAVFESNNQWIEFGVGASVNSRRSWILSRHSSVGPYGGYFSTLHLQPDIDGSENDYEGVAVAFDPSLKVSPDTGLAIGKRVGIGTVSPSALLHIDSPTDGANTVVAEFHSKRTGGANIYMRLKNTAYTGDGDYYFFADNSGRVGYHQSGVGNQFVLNQSGFLGLGTSTPDYKLDVKGTVRAEEVIVETGWSDFVFEDTYYLRSLDEVEVHIKDHGHLPDVPSAATVLSEGLSVGEAQKIMMQKIEELTLYVIELKKENDAQQREIETLKSN